MKLRAVQCNIYVSSGIADDDFVKWLLLIYAKTSYLLWVSLISEIWSSNVIYFEFKCFILLMTNSVISNSFSMYESSECKKYHSLCYWSWCILMIYFVWINESINDKLMYPLFMLGI